MKALKLCAFYYDGTRLNFTRLIIANAHEKTLHGGTSQILAHFRTNFWIPASRVKIKTQIIPSCVICSRFTTEATIPLVADLPKS